MIHRKWTKCPLAAVGIYCPQPEKLWTVSGQNDHNGYDQKKCYPIWVHIKKVVSGHFDHLPPNCKINFKQEAENLSSRR